MTSADILGLIPIVLIGLILMALLWWNVGGLNPGKVQ